MKMTKQHNNSKIFETRQLIWTFSFPQSLGESAGHGWGWNPRVCQLCVCSGGARGGAGDAGGGEGGDGERQRDELQRRGVQWRELRGRNNRLWSRVGLWSTTKPVFLLWGQTWTSSAKVRSSLHQVYIVLKLWCPYHSYTITQHSWNINDFSSAHAALHFRRARMWNPRWVSPTLASPLTASPSSQVASPQTWSAPLPSPPSSTTMPWPLSPPSPRPFIRWTSTARSIRPVWRRRWSVQRWWSQSRPPFPTFGSTSSATCLRATQKTFSVISIRASSHSTILTLLPSSTSGMHSPHSQSRPLILLFRPLPTYLGPVTQGSGIHTVVTSAWHVRPWWTIIMSVNL